MNSFCSSVRQGLFAGGNWIVDHIKIIDAWPPQDALANIVAQSSANGGSPYNILKDLAKLGASVPLEAVGLVGDDANGRFIFNDCRTHGIGTAQLRVTDVAATSYTDVMTVRHDGRRTFFHQCGANALLAPGHFDFNATRARHFHLGYALLLATLDAPTADGLPGLHHVLSAARAAGLTTSLDCVSEHSDRFQSVITPVLCEVDLLFVNDFEAEKLTGLDFGRGAALDLRTVQRAGRALLSQGVREWTIIHFPEGAYACSAKGEALWQPSVRFPAKLIAGAAGAGDAFAAGVLLGWHDAQPMARNLELGVCVAAASLRHPACSESVARVDECIELGRQFGFR
jgi:sugar/nucleoside kinase (ribokinase family)